MTNALPETFGHNSHDEKHLTELGTRVEHCLAELTQQQRGLRLEQAMHYCLFSGGKRLRPVLTLVAAESLGVPVERALHAACAVEMIHTASLVFDDLPCMDDARQRRGAPACHVSFGEDIAILAAITLITESFRVITKNQALTDMEKVQICGIISDALGVHGLTAGQERDLRDMEICTDANEIESMEQDKTCALFVACVHIAGVLGGLGESTVCSFKTFGRHLGLAFQIFDDLLDRFSDADRTGKDHRQDDGRATFITLMTPAEAEERALSELKKGLCILETIGMSSGRFELLIQTLFKSYQAQIK